MEYSRTFLAVPGNFRKKRKVSYQLNILEIESLGPSAPLLTTVTRWAKYFREGREDVNDHPQSTSPLFEFTGGNVELARQVISNDPHSTYDKIIAEISLFHSTNYPRLPQDETSDISLGIQSTNS